MIDTITATITISNEDVEVEISVNKHGNLVIGGVGSVIYDLLEEELVLTRYED